MPFDISEVIEREFFSVDTFFNQKIHYQSKKVNESTIYQHIGR